MQKHNQAADLRLRVSRSPMGVLLRFAAFFLGVLGVAAPIYVHVPATSIWPAWLVMASFVITGVYFLLYAVTGHGSVRSAYEAWRR